MKKIRFVLALSIMAVFGLVACHGTEEGACQDVANKINNHEELTNDDYTRMIEYVGEYAEKAQQYVVAADDAENQAALQKLQEEYPLVNLFRDCIKQTPADKFDSDNKALIEKYGGLVEFTMPESMSLTTDPDAAGVLVESPDSANGVIAGAVDTIKVEK